jgi:hypothetical protein
VLKVASTTTAGVKIRTGRSNSIGRGRENLQSICAVEALSYLSNLRNHSFARDGVPDEEDPAIKARNALPAMRNAIDLNFHPFTE